jgi:2'-5' RNA ligase
MTAGPKGPALPVAIDIAILPPADVSARAVALSAALPAGESQGLLLGGDRLPHITLTQQFVPSDSLDAVLAQFDRLAGGHPRLRLRVTGGGMGSNAVWMSVERTPELVGLHEQLQQMTEPFEVDTGDAPAFLGADARDRDVAWVRGFRRESSFDRFTPHITLGHASEPPIIDPFDFVATTIAVCHLGRFCTCRRIIRACSLGADVQ